VELRYKHVEAALADVMQVKPKSMAAFRARLRHLRNIGVPQLPNPGSGRPIHYFREQALQMLIALELEKIGQAPKNVAMVSQSILRQTPYGQYEGKDCYVRVSETHPGYTIAFGLEAFLQSMRSAPEISLIINVSACVRKLDAALNRALV
jgi:hypothetical protein